MKLVSSRLPCLCLIVFSAVGLWAPKPCFANWTKTIDCPEGRVYRDVRRDAGREEFCELQLPGSLKVQDGPARWWYSEGHFGEEGTYKAGRKVGRWKECDRFDRCRERTYEPLYLQEKARAVKPEIPLSYSRGKYVFDFNSCWSTWVTHQTPESVLELNISGGLIRCQVTYIPSVEKDRAAGNRGHYLCEIPYALGVRGFDSLDLRKEFPKAGLPQFCRQGDDAGTSVAAAMAISIWANTSFPDALTGKEVQAWTPVANMVDVECVALEHPLPGVERLTVRLNDYAAKLVLERTGREDLKTEICSGTFPLSAAETMRDASGRTLFTYRLSQNRATARRQLACIEAQTKLQPTCAAR